MMRARQHPCNRYGWLFCEPQHYQQAFEEQICLVKEELIEDPAFSGEPPALQAWADGQLLQVAKVPFYEKQLHAQADKLQSQVDAVVLQLERTLEELAAKADALMTERDHILSLFDADE
jgi:hypothetical protein